MSTGNAFRPALSIRSAKWPIQPTLYKEGFFYELLYSRSSPLHYISGIGHKSYSFREVQTITLQWRLQRCEKTCCCANIDYWHIKKPSMDIPYNGIKGSDQNSAWLVSPVVRFIHRYREWIGHAAYNFFKEMRDKGFLDNCCSFCTAIRKVFCYLRIWKHLGK